MSRPSTALRTWTVPGDNRAWVRLHPPGPSHPSWRVTFPLDGRVRERTRRTRQEAEALAQAIIDDLANRAAGLRTDQPIRRLVDHFMTVHADRKQWTATYRQERARAVRWLPDWFLDLPTGRWQVRHSDQVMSAVAAAGYRLGTAEYQRVGSLLSGLVTAGLRAGYLDPATVTGRGPMTGVDYRQIDGQRLRRGEDRNDPLRHLRPIGVDEIPGTGDVTAFAQRASDLHGSRWGAHALLLGFTGLRIGESLALQPADLHLADGGAHVDVTKQIQQVRTRFSDTGRGTLVDVPPKGGIARRAWIPPHLVPDLTVAVTQTTRSSDRVFSLTGTPMTPDRWRARIFHPVAQSLGWAQIDTGRRHHQSGTPVLRWQWTPHSLRHHAATWMLKDLGLPATVVAQYLGHATSAITERLYLDRTRLAFDGPDRAARAWLDAS